MKGTRGRPARSAWILAVVLCLDCSSRPPEDANYASKLAADRAAKDATFQKDSDPVPPSRKDELLPLAYYPIDPQYKVAAVLRPIDDQTVISIPTNSGAPRRMRRVGLLEFSLQGEPRTLTALVEVSAPNLNDLFVPFGDLTSGTETYPAGRYLDLRRNATGIYEIDFNRAYNPWCYYNESYECPFPPAENRLTIAVRAGEMVRTKS